MKAERIYQPHLAIRELSLAPGAEWTPPACGWSVLHVNSGVGYWMQGRMNFELVAGAAAVVSERPGGVLRSSQVNSMALNFYTVQPERLAGMLTLGEQQALAEAARKEQFGFRAFASAAPVAEGFRRALEEHSGLSDLSLRVQLLELFVGTFGKVLQAGGKAPAPELGAKGRLERYLKGMATADLLHLDFNDLVKEVRCTPRHTSRVFNEVAGVSFREKQAEVRLDRSLELLATTDAKMLDVAMDSGFQSLSLFNVMFKRRYGVTPSQWREDMSRRKARVKTNGGALGRGVEGNLVRC